MRGTGWCGVSHGVCGSNTSSFALGGLTEPRSTANRLVTPCFCSSLHPLHPSSPHRPIHPRCPLLKFTLVCFLPSSRPPTLPGSLASRDPTAFCQCTDCTCCRRHLHPPASGNIVTALRGFNRARLPSRASLAFLPHGLRLRASGRVSVWLRDVVAVARAHGSLDSWLCLACPRLHGSHSFPINNPPLPSSCFWIAYHIRQPLVEHHGRGSSPGLH